jgi:phage terminase large subunit GpA-like protein
MISPVERAARATWKAPDIRLPWEWCETHVTVDNTSSMPGPWRCNNSPWVRELMEVDADKSVTFIAVKCSAQSAKTQTILNLLCHDIAENPGPEMYVLANKEDCEDFVRDRFSPTVEHCAPVKELKLRETKLNFTFRTMPLYFVGAGSMAKLQGKPIKKLKLDEVRNYPPGALETVLKRVRAFGDLAQVMMISTPGKVGDAVDREFKRGDQRTYHFPCPCCGHMQQLRFTQLRWDTNDTTKPGGKWNFDELAKTIRYECENASCKFPILDTPTSRKLICRSGRFIRMNPNAPKHHVSFTWNALLPWWVKWRSIVEEFIAARAAIRAGDINPMKTFVNETLGESWEDTLGVIEDFGFLESRKQPYEYGEKWAEEIVRFMAADKQEKGGEHYWYVIRAFGRNGKSRLVTHGKAISYAELEQIRKDFGVKAANCMIDSGYDAQSVYRFCLGSGWKAFKGDHKPYYPVFKRLKHGGRKVFRQIWRKTEAAVYHPTSRLKIATIPLFTFCNDPAKDLLAEYMTGRLGEWTVSDEIGKDYMLQVTAERRQEKEDARGHIIHFWKQVRRDNHLGDCEIMLMLAAFIVGILRATPPPLKPAP